MNSEKQTVYPASREFLFLFDARDCNPNGERDSHASGPRIDPGTGKAIVTDLRIKRTMRDYWLSLNDPSLGSVLVRRNFVHDEHEVINFKDVLLNDMDIEEDALRTMKRESILDLIKEKFVDFRIFGSLFSISSEFFAVTGPVQFENCFSLNKPGILRLPISSTLSSSGDKGAGALGRYGILDYAVFPVHGILKQPLAEISGATEKDVTAIYDGFWHGLKTLNTRSKVNQLPRVMIGFVMKKPGYQINGLRDVFEDFEAPITSFTDMSLEIAGLKEVIKKYKEKIQFVEYREDVSMNYTLDGTHVSSIADLADSIERCPAFKPI